MASSVSSKATREAHVGSKCSALTRGAGSVESLDCLEVGPDKFLL